MIKGIFSSVCSVQLMQNKFISSVISRNCQNRDLSKETTKTDFWRADSLLLCNNYNHINCGEIFSSSDEDGTSLSIWMIHQRTDFQVG